jgi:hypothetical protein
MFKSIIAGKRVAVIKVRVSLREVNYYEYKFNNWKNTGINFSRDTGAALMKRSSSYFCSSGRTLKTVFVCMTLGNGDNVDKVVQVFPSYD